jgi:hypothetical protein
MLPLTKNRIRSRGDIRGNAKVRCVPELARAVLEESQGGAIGGVIARRYGV